MRRVCTSCFPGSSRSHSRTRSRRRSRGTNRSSRALPRLRRVGYETSKRLFAVAAAAGALVVLSPLLLVIAVLVRVVIGSPVLFRQVRPGRDGTPFELLKFRTMTDARGPDGALLPDRERLTRLGRTLRATSVDELP